MGAKIKARPAGAILFLYWFTIWLTMGKTKDNVFPLPVSDRHNKSWSFKLCYKVFYWIRVGFSYFIIYKAETIYGYRPKSENCLF